MKKINKEDLSLKTSDVTALDARSRGYERTTQTDPELTVCCDTAADGMCNTKTNNATCYYQTCPETNAKENCGGFQTIVTCQATNANCPGSKENCPLDTKDACLPETKYQCYQTQVCMVTRDICEPTDDCNGGNLEQ